MYTLLMNSVLRFAATPTDCGQTNTFFGLKPWFYYLKLGSDCSLDGGTTGPGFTVLTDTGKSDFLLIALAIVDDLLRLASLVAVGFVIYGGIQYITSQGSPDGTKKAQQTIINALIGLAIALVAAGFVSYIGTKIGNAQ